MKNTKIEYCDSTWNPVTGCLNNCPYCYARDLAYRFRGWKRSPDGSTDNPIVDLSFPLRKQQKRGKYIQAPYPFGFTPTFRRYKLDELEKTHMGKTIFVCSMGDLFGDWVPDDWITAVFESCKKSPQHRYLFLTKNPERYIQLSEKGLLPDNENFWFGTTVTTQDTPFFWSDKHHTYLSIEPIQLPFDKPESLEHLNSVDWVIIGAETGNHKGKIVPEKEWIQPIVDVCQDMEIPLFMKGSLRSVWGKDLVTELPWEK